MPQGDILDVPGNVLGADLDPVPHVEGTENGDEHPAHQVPYALLGGEAQGHRQEAGARKDGGDGGGKGGHLLHGDHHPHDIQGDDQYAVQQLIPDVVRTFGELGPGVLRLFQNEFQKDGQEPGDDQHQNDLDDRV